MTWRKLANLVNPFASRPEQPVDPVRELYSLPPNMDVRKLTAALPGILGKTIAHIVLTARIGDRSQLFLVFTDETHYEFYAIDTLSGARGVDRGGLSTVKGWNNDAEMQIVVSPAA